MRIIAAILFFIYQCEAMQYLEQMVDEIEKEITNATGRPSMGKKPGYGFSEATDKKIAGLKSNIDDLMYSGIYDAGDTEEKLGYRQSDSDEEVYKTARLWFKANFLVDMWNKNLANAGYKNLLNVYGDEEAGATEVEYNEHTQIANEIALFARRVVIDPEVILNPYRNKKNIMISDHVCPVFSKEISLSNRLLQSGRCGLRLP